MSASYHEPRSLSDPRPGVVLVDVGFTLTFWDGTRIAEHAAAAGVRVDAAIVGSVKPDARIFRIALERLGVAPDDAVMIGDLPTADVFGPRALGIRAGLIDPHDIHPWVDAPRFKDLPAFAAAIVGAGL